MQKKKIQSASRQGCRTGLLMHCTCSCAVDPLHYCTCSEKKLIFFWSLSVHPFPRDSFPRTKTIISIFRCLLVQKKQSLYSTCPYVQLWSGFTVREVVTFSSVFWLSVTSWVFYFRLSLTFVLIIVLVWHIPSLGPRLFLFGWKWKNSYPSHTISFMTTIPSTSGRLHCEFVCLLFLKTHRETDRFLVVAGVHLVQTNFHFRRVVFSSLIKSKVVHILTKTVALQIMLNIDGTPIDSRFRSRFMCCS